jgi:uncharacterized membrane protein (UPF0127 family)
MRRGWLLRDGDVLAAADMAESLFDRTRGLLGHATFDGALLLAHTRSVHTFGMRFALDVAFMDGELVVRSVTHAPAWRVCLPRRGCRVVLEAAAGSFDRWGLQVGDRLEFRETAEEP